jgi:hypothetical protein
MSNSLQQDNTSRGLSSKELKQKLVQVVKNKGIYDSMKVTSCHLKYLSVVMDKSLIINIF